MNNNVQPLGMFIADQLEDSELNSVTGGRGPIGTYTQEPKTMTDYGDGGSGADDGFGLQSDD